MAVAMVEQDTEQVKKVVEPEELLIFALQEIPLATD